MVHAENAVDVIDIEEHAKQGKKPPKAKQYRIRIDKERFEVTVPPDKTGGDLLALVGKTPATHQLFQKMHGGNLIEITTDEIVDFTTAGVERFVTLPLDQTDGTKRREFELPEEDLLFLEDSDYQWEAVVAEGEKWVVVHGYPIPKGYNVSSASVAIKIDPTYPETQIDMANFFTLLSASSGKIINNLSERNLDGKKWQQWSRHRTDANPWRSGLDNIETHLALVNFWLKKEVKGN